MKTKKIDYISPEMSIVSLAPCEILATSSPTFRISNMQGEADDDFAHGHRGSWGNLWDNEE